MANAARQPSGLQRFLAWEERQALRAEFDERDRIAMVGGTPAMFEVLSEGTAQRDLGAKPRVYEAIVSVPRSIIQEPDAVAGTQSERIDDDWVRPYCAG
jgi:hypothetical protein